MAFQKLILTNFSDYPTNPATLVTVPEGASNGYVISPITIQDSNPSAVYKLTMSDGASGRFNILLLNGVYNLTVRDTSVIDYESNTSHNVVIRAVDQANIVTNTTITINILNDDTLISVIKSISPKASTKSNPVEITIAGNNFMEGGAPIVTVNENAVKLASFTNNIITFMLLTDYEGDFVYDVKVLNGYEQSLL